MDLRVLESARSDAQAAYDWYADRSLRAADRFADALDQALQRIEDFPHASPELRPGIRKQMIRGFPFAVLFRAETHEIVVTAVADLRRDPGSSPAALR